MIRLLLVGLVLVTSKTNALLLCSDLLSWTLLTSLLSPLLESEAPHPLPTSRWHDGTHTSNIDFVEFNRGVIMIVVRSFEEVCALKASTSLFIIISLTVV